VQGFIEHRPDFRLIIPVKDWTGYIRIRMEHPEHSTMSREHRGASNEGTEHGIFAVFPLRHDPRVVPAISQFQLKKHLHMTAELTYYFSRTVGMKSYRFCTQPFSSASCSRSVGRSRYSATGILASVTTTVASRMYRIAQRISKRCKMCKLARRVEVWKQDETGWFARRSDSIGDDRESLWSDAGSESTGTTGAIRPCGHVSLREHSCLAPNVALTDV